jgi:hypothetical protein
MFFVVHGSYETNNYFRYMYMAIPAKNHLMKVQWCYSNNILYGKIALSLTN